MASSSKTDLIKMNLHESPVGFYIQDCVRKMEFWFPEGGFSIQKVAESCTKRWKELSVDMKQKYEKDYNDFLSGNKKTTGAVQQVEVKAEVDTEIVNKTEEASKAMDDNNHDIAATLAMMKQEVPSDFEDDVDEDEMDMNSYRVSEPENNLSLNLTADITIVIIRT